MGEVGFPFLVPFIPLSHQARFVLILLVGAFDVCCAVILIQSESRMAFRVGGALESLQAQYFMLNLCFSMLTFDLQAQVAPGTKPRSCFESRACPVTWASRMSPFLPPKITNERTERLLAHI